MLGSDMGMSEYLRRSGELSDEGSGRRTTGQGRDPSRLGRRPRRSTPLPDTYVPPARRAPASCPPSLAEEDEPVLNTAHSLPLDLHPLPRQPSGASLRSGTSSTGGLLDMQMDGRTPQKQAQMVQSVVRTLEEDQDWLGLAVYLSVVGQYMSQQVGDVNLGPVRRRLATHVQSATQGSEAGSSSGPSTVSSPDTAIAFNERARGLLRKFWPKRRAAR